MLMLIMYGLCLFTGVIEHLLTSESCTQVLQGLGYSLQWSRASSGYSDIGFNTQYQWSDSDAYQNLLERKTET